MYKQADKWGCGMYAVANALNLTDFVSDWRLEKSKEGNNIGQLSKWLQDDGHDAFIDVWFFDKNKTELSHDAKNIRPYKKDSHKDSSAVLSFPVLLNVNYSPESLNHLVAGNIMEDGYMFLYDSLSDGAEYTTLEEAHSKYFAVFGMFFFRRLSDGEYIFMENFEKQ